MSKDIETKEPKEVKETKKPISEETLHIIANLILTTVSTAALMVSIVTGMKGKKRS